MESAIYLGVNGSVIALDRSTGTELWSVFLKGSGFVNVVLDNDLVLATTKGECFCLNAASGELLWQNGLPGQGRGIVAIATTSDNSNAAIFREKQKQDEAASAAVIAASS